MAKTHISAKVMDTLGNADNLRNFLLSATPAEMAHGTSWYVTARLAAQQIAHRYNVTLAQAAHVIAALSPQVDWEENLRMAQRVTREWADGTLVAPTWPGLNANGVVLGLAEIAAAYSSNLEGYTPYASNVCKALWILEGHLCALHGEKVTDFADNIIRDNPDSVTVDSHYVMAWLGLAYSGTYRFDDRYHAIVTEDTRKIAQEFGLSPREVQAIVWVAKKRIQGTRRTSNEAIAIFNAIVGGAA